jgi:hypothetical protein
VQPDRPAQLDLKEFKVRQEQPDRQELPDHKVQQGLTAPTALMEQPF